MKKIIEIRVIGEINAKAYKDSTKYIKVTKDIKHICYVRENAASRKRIKQRINSKYNIVRRFK